MVFSVIIDIIDAADKQTMTLLSLLDMRAALDAVERRILLTQLEVTYGIGGNALGWVFFRSIRGEGKSWRLLKSVLSRHSSSAASHRSLAVHRADIMDNARCRLLLDCTAEIDRQMTSNRLKINADEIELIWICIHGTNSQLESSASQLP